MDAQKEGFHAVGKRKSAIAKVWLRPSKGDVAHSVNGKDLLVYFNRPGLVAAIQEPLNVAGVGDRVVVVAETLGGGLSGQAGALRLGIARALQRMDETLHGTLRAHGMLTRDPREKERKKYGMAGARKRFQFSKR
ncbi:MAG: 30S ribosomal protein S9 [candidate division Zixibacteria bacterium]|nr:30S ribosomal protein S9 [candidate division Zixibacteria bacterium]